MNLYTIDYKKLRNKIGSILDDNNINHRNRQDIIDIIEEEIEDATIKEIIDGFVTIGKKSDMLDLLQEYPNYHLFETVNILDSAKIEILRELYKKSLRQLEKLV